MVFYSQLLGQVYEQLDCLAFLIGPPVLCDIKINLSVWLVRQLYFLPSGGTERFKRFFWTIAALPIPCCWQCGCMLQGSVSIQPRANPNTFTAILSLKEANKAKELGQAHSIAAFQQH